MGNETYRSYDKYRWSSFARSGWVAFVSVAGVLLTLVSAYAEFAGSLTHPRIWLAAVLLGPLVVGLVVGASTARNLRDVRVPVARALGVRVVVGDFLDNVEQFGDASCVFGVNDTFAVTELMQNSIHAQFLEKYFPDSNAEERQEQLDLALDQSGLVRAASSGTSGSQSRVHHAHGTVACMEFGRRGDGGPRHAFLMANSRRQVHGYSGNELSGSSIRNVWDYHERAQLRTDQMVFALVGTGNSGYLTPMASLFHVIEEFFRDLETNGESRTAIKNLVLSIHPRAVQDGAVDLGVVHTYLKARARFSPALR